VADPVEARRVYGVELLPWDALPRAHAVVAAVAHREFAQRPLADYVALLETDGAFIDVKAQFDAEALRERGVRVWRL
jgi:UDP-N-acetyl-D-galactosamine dehydrogenase